MRKYNLKKFQEIKLIWQDAMSDVGTWAHEDDFNFALHCMRAINSTLGFFIKIYKGNLLVARDYNLSDETISGIFSVPLACIIKIIRMKD